MNTIRCNCGTPLKIKPEMAGKQVRCPNCKLVLPVPAGAASETSGPPRDASRSPEPPAANRPRLRSEALRAAAPVTRVQAAATSDIPVVKTVAGIVAPVAAASIPTMPSPAPPAPPDIQQRQPRVVPPVAPPAIADLEPLPDLEPLDPLAPSAWSGGPLSPSALSPSPRPMQPPAVSRAASDKRGSKSLALWIGGGVIMLVLLIVAFLAGRGGSSKPPDENLASESAPHQRIEEPAPEPTPVAVATPPTERPVVAPTVKEPAPPPSQIPDPAVENPAEAVKQVAPAKAAPPPRGSNGLTGVSRQYDDLDCARIQAQHAVRVPAAATILEVDGQRLPITNLGVLAESPAPYLYLPRGTHAVKFRKNETPLEVTIQSDLSQVYHEMRQFFDAGGNVRESELLSRGAKAMDVHSAPFLLNLMAGAHLGKQQPEPAERKVRRALRVNPLFAPAHLNLAALLAQRGATAEARAELELAEATNVGNCFGLSPAIYELRRQLKPPALLAGSEIPLSSYVTQESLSEEDRRLTALMQGLSKYAVEDAERGKILNNLAVHFAESNRTELALDHFRSALSVLKSAGPERYKLAQQVLTNMKDACQQANYEEADEYDRMRNQVSP